MRRTTFAIVLALVVFGIGILGYRQIAYAFSCGKSTCGYFTSSGNGSAWYDVLQQPALNNVSDANGFINTMNGYLNSGSTQNSMGAAFLIDNMLKYKGKVADNVGGGVTAGKNYAKANFNTWKNLVNFYAAGGSGYGINWSYKPSQQAFCSGRIDSGYDNNGSPNYTGVNDDILYHTPAYGTNACNYEYTNSMPEIHIYWPGGQFNIGKHCGNLQDIENAIPSPNSSPTGTISVACDPATGQQTATVTLSDPDAATNGYITTNGWTSGTVNSPGPTDIAIPLPPTTDPYVAQGVSLHVKDTGSLGSGNYTVVASANTQVPCASFACGSLTVTPSELDPYMQFSLGVSVTNNIGQTPPAGTITLTITPPAGATYNYSGSQAAGGSGNVSSATFNSLGPTNKTGLYTAKWVLTGSGVNQTCTATFPVVYLPYLNVYGGDVMTGASPTVSSGSSTCVVDADGGIFGWNNVSASYAGAGTQYAVQALGAIQYFATALGSTNTPPAGLSLANNFTPADPMKLNTGQGLFGGYFTEPTADCDFTSDLKSPQTATVDKTFGATTVAAGISDVWLVTNADVYISGNIAYANTGGWANVSQIPYFKLVVTGGDIYIDRNVTQLDGIYVAEPDGSGNHGRIYTCATGLRAAINPVSANYYSNCNAKLTINGVFVAKQVQFLRTNGSVGQAKSTDTLSSNHSAEVFNYTPELWLPRGANTPDSGYTAITGLPPIL